MKLSALETALRAEVKAAFNLDDAQLKHFTVSAPPSHIKADLSVAWPIAAARTLKKPPLRIAEELKAALTGKYDAQVLPPGFVNINLKDSVLVDAAGQILSDAGYFLNPAYAKEKINIEFVSANPTGPMHLASGRGATLGDSLARIMRFLGYSVAEEFYVNNMGKQVERLGASLKARSLGAEPPEDGYKGGYLKDIAAGLPEDASGWTDKQFSEYAVNSMLALHKADMKAFGVEFDRWFLESELHENKSPERTLEELQKRGMIYEKEGAVWLGTSTVMDSDDKDRVLVKSDGHNTYFLNDISYHLNKLDRGFTKLIDIWGADHHGHVPRMETAISALSGEKEAFKVIIHQMVALKRGAETVKMSKREGDFVSLKELLEEVGPDACRFFFAMHSPNSHMTFDIDLAKKRSNDNPVFYVQYVHARICSIFNNAEDKGVDPGTVFDAAKVALNSEERGMIMKMMWFGGVLEACVRDSSPHLLTTYLSELSAMFHSFYDKHKVLDASDPGTTAFRLFLLKAVKHVIAQGLGLLGVTAPEKM
ncbi:MAG: arginine--tRNA ligase [Elusimicrobia bacterium RIFOXYA12_FULL_51_18]|nr:MAG: arginine--tRNA ligase [Elusimicrobia bacterium RIFOXYA12_FULL_51_18]OGS30617.1 MAG: arginine--tRNA ligase [Elusimicrobia bacterium RIFOXYA2_FULL_53_38]